MISQSDDNLYITYAWWVDGADHYNTCSAVLSKGFGADTAPDPRAAAPAFEKACQAVNVKTVEN